MRRGALFGPDESMGQMALGFGRDVVLLGSGSFPASHCNGHAYDDETEDLSEEDVMWGGDRHHGEQGNEQTLRMLADMKMSTTPSAANKSLSRGRRSWLSVEMEAATARRSELKKRGVESNGDGGGMPSGKEGMFMRVSQLSSGVDEYSKGWNNGAIDVKGVPQSAPLMVPAWAKALGRPLGKEDGGGEDDDDEGLGGSMRLPPHEMVARQQVTTFSVFEGTGRTLKGMDMRRVRNAVWRRTGFMD